MKWLRVGQYGMAIDETAREALYRAFSEMMRFQKRVASIHRLECLVVTGGICNCDPMWLALEKSVGTERPDWNG